MKSPHEFLDYLDWIDIHEVRKIMNSDCGRNFERPRLLGFFWRGHSLLFRVASSSGGTA